jgi:predicted metal-binding membrane protein
MLVYAPWTSTHDDRPFLIVAIGMVVLAWVSLAVWGLSPYDRYLSHHALDLVGTGAAGLLLWVFVGGWTLMVIAMMLPTSLQLLFVFRRVTGGRANRNTLISLVLAGYLLAWVAFGMLVILADLGLHQFVHASTLLTAHPWLMTAGVFGIAGAYQFTSLKYQCLDKCRSPLSFVTSYWSGRNEGRNALMLGVHHGIFCVGCCWSLMLLMFAVGHGNLGWMLLLGVVMGAEKNLRWGRSLSKPLGIVLLSTAGLIIGIGVYS